MHFKIRVCVAPLTVAIAKDKLVLLYECYRENGDRGSADEERHRWLIFIYIFL